MPCSLGKVITSLREAKGWSMGTLALYSGLTTGAISQIESGRTKSPSAQTIGKLAEALDATPNYLFEHVGWYKAKGSPALPPEVRRLAQVIEGYPPGPAKMQAKQMVRDVAVILETLAERMEEKPVEANEGGSVI